MKNTKNKEGKFHFEGKYFYDEEEFWKWILLWQSLKLNNETAIKKLEILKNNIIINIQEKGIEFTNYEFEIFVKKILKFSIQELINERKNR